MTAQPTQSVTWNDATARTVLRQLFDAAVRCADPGEAVRRHLPERPVGRCVVVGAGKAAAAMAAALDAAWPDVDVSGVVVTRYGHAGAAGHDAHLPARQPQSAPPLRAVSQSQLQAASRWLGDSLLPAVRPPPAASPCSKPHTRYRMRPACGPHGASCRRCRD